jgi:hypothetical protein
MTTNVKTFVKVIGCLGAVVLVFIGGVYLLIGSLFSSSDSPPSWKSELPATATEIMESGFAEGFIPDYSYILRAKISESEFTEFCSRLKLTPHSETRVYPDEENWLSWSSPPMVDADDWWIPTESLEKTFVRQDGHTWSFAKHEEGYLYFQSLCH